MSSTQDKILDILNTWYKPHQVAMFMRSHQAMLNDEIPADMIASGRAKEVLRAVYKFDRGYS